MDTTQVWRRAARLSQYAAAVGLFALMRVAPAGAGPILIATVQSGSCNGGLPTSQTSSTLAIAHQACDDGRGPISADANAAPGVLGVGASAVHYYVNSTPLDQYGQAEYMDLVTFSRLDPSLPSTLAVSLNLDLEGSLALTPVGGTILSGWAQLFNVVEGSFYVDQNGPLQASGFTVTGQTGPAIVDASLTSATGTAVIDQPYEYRMRISAHAGVNFGGTSTVDFLNTFGFPSDRTVFNLPDGYTANAGNYLVNNRLVGAAPVPSEVPEPGTFGLVVMTIAGLLVRRSLSGGGWLAPRRRA